MKLNLVNISKTNSNHFSALKNPLQQYLPTIQVTNLLLVLLLFCWACGNKSKELQPDIKFDQTKWSVKNGENYIHRKQMVNDLLNNYQWAGVKKDSVIHVLGQPDAFEEGGLTYDYENKPFLGGLGTKIETIVFELAPDSTVKVARFNDGGWD